MRAVAVFRSKAAEYLLHRIVRTRALDDARAPRLPENGGTRSLELGELVAMSVGSRSRRGYGLRRIDEPGPSFLSAADARAQLLPPCAVDHGPGREIENKAHGLYRWVGRRNHRARAAGARADFNEPHNDAQLHGASSWNARLERSTSSRNRSTPDVTWSPSRRGTRSARSCAR